MPRLPDFNEIDYLVSKRFLTNLKGSPSPFADNSAKDIFEEPAQKQSQYRTELRKKSSAEIAELVRLERQKEAELEKHRLKRDEAERWFNQPYCNADFTHWSKAAYWTLEEGIALSFGKEPTRIDWNSIKSSQSVSPFVARYFRRLDLARRAAAMNLLSTSNLPGFFLGWAKRNEMEPPPILCELVEKNGQIIADWPELLKLAHQNTREAFEQGAKHRDEALAQGQRFVAETREAWKADANKLVEKISALEAENRSLKSSHIVALSQDDHPINAKSKLSLLKIVLGMAIDGYGFNPKSPRSPLPRELSTSLAALDITIDESTVRSWLHEAISEVNYKPKD